MLDVDTDTVNLSAIYITFISFIYECEQKCFFFCTYTDETTLSGMVLYRAISMS